MNGVQLTFFNFSGYLIPGFVLTIAMFPVVVVYPEAGANIGWLIDAVVLEKFGLIGAPLVAALFLPSLAIIFFLGVILSDTSMWLITAISLNVWRTKGTHSSGLFEELTDKGRVEALHDKYMLREMVSLKSTGGWDYYGAAGRARMLTASGLALIIAATVYFFASYMAATALFLSGVYSIILGRNLSVYNNDMCDILAFLEESQLTTTPNAT